MGHLVIVVDCFCVRCDDQGKNECDVEKERNPRFGHLHWILSRVGVFEKV